MIRATGAKLRMLASESLSFLLSEARAVVFGDGDKEVWDMIGRVTAVARPEVQRLRSGLNDWPIVKHARVIDAILEAMPVTTSLNMQRRIFFVRTNQEEGSRKWRTNHLLLEAICLVL
jgi:hypothetical protein